MIKVYLELIKYKIAKSSGQDEQMTSIRNTIKAIVADIESHGQVTSYEAFNYFSVNPNWDNYNVIFQTEFTKEYNIIHQRYKEYTEQQSKK
jgi:predicted double-glycine peptidase